MKTKLQTLFIIGALILVAPLLHFSSTVKMILTLLVGLSIIYITWRIRVHYKTLTLKLRRYEETPIVQ